MSDNVVKIVVIGDIGVGKSSIIRRYVDNDYTPEYKISVQLDFKQKQVIWLEKLSGTVKGKNKEIIYCH